jgi:hypothetical protein
VRGVLWALVVTITGCIRGPGPPLHTYAAAPEQPPPGPSQPVCSDQPVQTAGVITGDIVTCQGNYVVPYNAMKGAGMAQGSRYALLARKTHVLLVGETHWSTQGQINGVQCQTSETAESRQARAWQAAGEALASSNTTTHANCRNNYVGGVDCDATTSGGYRPSAAPPIRTDTVCSGGDVVPGTEGHVLQLSLSFLGPDEAAGLPMALSAYRILGYPEPAPQSAPIRTSVSPADDVVPAGHSPRD